MTTRLFPTAILILLVGCSAPTRPDVPTQTLPPSAPMLAPSATILPPSTPTHSPTSAATLTIPQDSGIRLYALDMKSMANGWAIGRILPDDAPYYFPPRVVVTEDGGQTWVDRSPGFPTLDPELLLLPGPSAGFLFHDARAAWAIYPGLEQPVWRTLDGGSTWQVSSQTFMTRGIGSEFFFLDHMRGWLLVFIDALTNSSVATDLFRTLDGGATWEQLASATGDGSLNSCGKGGVAFADHSTGWIALSCPDTPPSYFRTFDGGRTWTQEFAPPPSVEESYYCFSYDVYSPVLFEPSKGSFLVSCSGGSLETLAHPGYLYTTSDSGHSWATYPLPAPEVAFINPQVLWAFDDSHLFLSTDGGVTWEAEPLFPWEGNFSFIDERTLFAISYPLDSAGNRIVQAKSTLFSIDGALTWQEIPPGSPP